MPSAVAVSALVVAYGEEPELGHCLRALLDSEGVAIEVVVVDNGDRSGAVGEFEDDQRVRICRPGSNLGFAAGCNLAAAAATGDVLALVNPDAVVAPDALVHLVNALDSPGVGIATASVRLAEAPDTMNSAGNPVHYLGLAWAGGHGEPASAHADPATVASASGACCALRAEVWFQLGGFDPAYFAYHEDVEFSLRCWQRGLSVVYVPDAVVVHHYAFSRNDLKNFLLERNRLLTVLTTYSGRTLLGLAVPLLALEATVLAVAARAGWLPAKVRGYRWLVRHRTQIRRRRQRLQGERLCSDHDLAGIYAVTFDPGPGTVPAGRLTALANRASAAGGRVFVWWAR